MLSISGYSGHGDWYSSSAVSDLRRSGAAQRAQSNAARTASRTAVIPAAQTGTPVQPVNAVKAPSSVSLDRKDMLGRLDNDPAANAARSRIRYNGQRPGAVEGRKQTVEQVKATGSETAYSSRNARGSFQAQRSAGSYDPRRAVGDMTTPAPRGAGKDFDMPGAVPTPNDLEFTTEQIDQDSMPALPGVKKQVNEQVLGNDVKTAQDVASDSECETCKNRKYQDGSDDPGVSFKAPTHIDPDQAASAVAGHENEHVVRNQAKAQAEGRRVVSQSVTYHTAICPECGRTYISGGTTRTVTADKEDPIQDNIDAIRKSEHSAAVEPPDPAEKRVEDTASFKAENLRAGADVTRFLPGSQSGRTQAEQSLPGARADRAQARQFLPGAKTDKAQTNQFLPGAKADKAQTNQPPLPGSSNKNGTSKTGNTQTAKDSRTGRTNRAAVRRLFGNTDNTKTLNKLLGGKNRLQNAKFLLGNRSSAQSDQQRQNVAYALFGGTGSLR